MLNENIQTLRKQKGYTQQTLAAELNVVRQTVSKWEKGYSIPDAVMLERIAELLEVSVTDLLGDTAQAKSDNADLNQISEQLSVLNNQLAKELARKRRIRKALLIVLAVFSALAIIAGAVCLIARQQYAYEISPESDYITVNPLNPELETAVSEAILAANASENASGEFPTQSHFVFGCENKKGTIKVYLYESFIRFGFKDGFFTDVGGSSTPVVLSFQVKDGAYELLSRETAKDGSDYSASIKEMFPARYAKQFLSESFPGEIGENMWLEEAAKAREYLKSIQREAIVCKYSDIKTVFLSDYGIDDEISNKVCDLGLEYDYTIGNHEKIENGKRYVYQTAYDLKTNQITFTKFQYDTNHIVEFLAMDAATGELLKNAPAPEKVVYYHGEMIQGD